MAVTARRAGVSQLWVIECKQWKRRVGKDRVLTLSGVVADIGADRGLLLSESGFQAGAIRVATGLNITLTSLTDLRDNASEELAQVEAHSALHRIVVLQDRTRGLVVHDVHGRVGRWLPGVDSNVILPLMGRLSLAREGLARASIGLLPTLVDLSPDERGIVARSVEDAVVIASDLAEVAEPQILEAERLAMARPEVRQL